MSTTTAGKRSLAIACNDACEFRGLFGDCFETWTVAGSVRRQVDQIGDVEHVIIPRLGEYQVDAGGATGGLFAEKRTGNLVWARLEQLIGDRTRGEPLTQHIYNGAVRWGEKYRGVDWRGFNHELFMADEHNWGPTLAIRTGPADFSRMLVTMMQGRGYRNRRGYVWNWRDWSCTGGWVGDHVEYLRTVLVEPGISVNGRTTGSRLQGGWTEKMRDGVEMTAVCLNCRRHEGLNPARVSVPTEQAYFKLCGVDWREPRERR